MPQPEKQPRTIRTSRDCPVCGAGVHWSRYWFPASIHAQWTCPKCGTLLGYESQSLLLLFVVVVFFAAFFALVRLFVSIYWALPLIVGGWAVAAMVKRVTVIANQNPQYCPTCRYNLTGTLAAGLNRCPECGRPIDGASSSSP